MLSRFYDSLVTPTEVFLSSPLKSSLERIGNSKALFFRGKLGDDWIQISRSGVTQMLGGRLLQGLHDILMLMDEKAGFGGIPEIHSKFLLLCDMRL